jgi:molecular chaperone GrpE (heat shock protein)
VRKTSKGDAESVSIERDELKQRCDKHNAELAQLTQQLAAKQQSNNADALSSITSQLNAVTQQFQAAQVAANQYEKQLAEANRLIASLEQMCFDKEVGLGLVGGS